MGLLQPRLNFEDALAATISLGKEEPWSSQGFYRHLELFENTIPIVLYFVTTSWGSSQPLLERNKRSDLVLRKYILNINDNFLGATYKQSQVLNSTSTDMPGVHQVLVPPLWPYFIAATLLHWVKSIYNFPSAFF